MINHARYSHVYIVRLLKQDSFLLNEVIHPFAFSLISDFIYVHNFLFYKINFASCVKSIRVKFYLYTVTFGSIKREIKQTGY